MTDTPIKAETLRILEQQFGLNAFTARSVYNTPDWQPNRKWKEALQLATKQALQNLEDPSQ